MREILEKRFMVPDNPSSDLLADESRVHLFPPEDLKVVQDIGLLFLYFQFGRCHSYLT